MPRRDDDPWQDPRDYPDPDVDTEGGALPCPNCLAVIHEESPRCPRCGEYLTSHDAGRKPLWIVIGVSVCLALAILGIWFSR